MKRCATDADLRKLYPSDSLGAVKLSAAAKALEEGILTGESDINALFAAFAHTQQTMFGSAKKWMRENQVLVD